MPLSLSMFLKSNPQVQDSGPSCLTIKLNMYMPNEWKISPLVNWLPLGQMLSSGQTFFDWGDVPWRDCWHVPSSVGADLFGSHFHDLLLSEFQFTFLQNGINDTCSLWLRGVQYQVRSWIWKCFISCQAVSVLVSHMHLENVGDGKVSLPVHFHFSVLSSPGKPLTGSLLVPFHLLPQGHSGCVNCLEWNEKGE